jgi:hypothetical protein
MRISPSEERLGAADESIPWRGLYYVVYIEMSKSREQESKRAAYCL